MGELGPMGFFQVQNFGSGLPFVSEGLEEVPSTRPTSDRPFLKAKRKKGLCFSSSPLEGPMRKNGLGVLHVNPFQAIRGF